MKIIILIYFYLYLYTSCLQLSFNSNNKLSPPLISYNPKCKLCIEMYDYKFNYDSFISQHTEPSIQNEAKDISVQFFLKSPSISPCQRSKGESFCDSIKKNFCESLLDIKCTEDDTIDNTIASFVEKETIGWKPNKPVLLDNFQNNIGDQLKEISMLTNEVTKTERHLKELKQKLANKLEIVQSSYNVVQKTLADISKMVNDNNFSGGLTNEKELSQSKDDWDQHSNSRWK